MVSETTWWGACSACGSERRDCRDGDDCCAECRSTGGVTHDHEPCAEFGSHPRGKHHATLLAKDCSDPNAAIAYRAAVPVSDKARADRAESRVADLEARNALLSDRLAEAEAKVRRVEKHMAFRERLGSDSSPHYEIRAALSGGDES